MEVTSGNLKERLRHATVVPTSEIGPDVVTMGSEVRIRDVQSDRAELLVLVFHGESGMFDNKLSVLTSLGTKLLGARKGDLIEWRLPRGVRWVQLERVSQPKPTAADLSASS